ncbi:MAG: hypothetical protein WCO93_04860 [bacterium]
MKRFALLAVMVFFATVICMGEYLSAPSEGHTLYSESQNQTPGETSDRYELTIHDTGDEDGLHLAFFEEMPLSYFTMENVQPVTQFTPDCLPTPVWQPPKTI